MNSLDDPGGAPNAELPDPDPPPGGWWAASPAGRVDAAPDALSALAAAADAGRVQLAALLDATAGGGLADRPRLVLADALTGARLTRTDLPGLRRAAHCGAGA